MSNKYLTGVSGEIEMGLKMRYLCCLTHFNPPINNNDFVFSSYIYVTLKLKYY